MNEGMGRVIVVAVVLLMVCQETRSRTVDSTFEEVEREKRDIPKSILEDLPGIQLAFTGTGGNA